MTFEAVNLTPRIGSQVRIGLDDMLSGVYRDDLRALLVQRGVLLFRDIAMTVEQQRSFTRTLGDLRLGTVKKEGEEGLMKVTFEKEKNPDYAKFFAGSLLWHVDGTYDEVPPFATVVRPEVLSQDGGQTEFANTYAAYDDLPDGEKARLDGLMVVHTLQASMFPAIPDCTPEQFALWSSYPARIHPLVWHHKSGRKSLALGHSASHIVGMHPADSHDLLLRLMAHATQDKYVYRHHWRMDDTLIWDNTGTMHRARPYDTQSGRTLNRFTLNGEEPIAAAAA